MDKSSSWLFTLTLFSALGSGLIGGVFFAFSTFVMNALARLPAAQGIAAMQAINITVINPLFMAAFLGTAVTGLAAMGTSLFLWPKPGIYLFAGGLLYIGGVFLVTMRFNVPRNNALMTFDSATAEGAKLWARYLVEWGAWNHVRTISGLASAVLFTIAIYYLQ